MKTAERVPVILRRSADGMSFVSATDALYITDLCAQRCELFEELGEIDDSSTSDVPLPLFMPEVKAWLACAQQVASGAGRSRFLLNQDDDTLINALKVRNLSCPFTSEHHME